MKVISRLLFLTRSPVCRLSGPLFSSSSHSVLRNSKLYYGSVELSTEENVLRGERSQTFAPTESSFYHSILETDPKYSDTLVMPIYFDNVLENVPSTSANLDDDITQLDIQCLCPLFRDVTQKLQSEELDVHSEKIVPLASYIKKNYKCLAGDDIRKLLALLYLWPVQDKLSHKPIKTIVLALDAACVAYVLNSNRPIEETLLLMEMWHWLNLCSISEFMQMATGRLFWKVDKHGHIIQLLMYMSELRTLPNHYDKPSIEKKVARFMRYFKPNEIGIMAAGFHKTKTKITYYALYKQVVTRVIKDLAKFDDICLNAVLKVLRSSARNFKEKEDIEAIQQAVLPRITQLSGMPLVQLAMLGTTMEVNNRSVMLAILEELSKQTNELREKDFQRVMYACATSLNEQDVSPFVNEVVSEIYKRGLPTLHQSKTAPFGQATRKKLVSFIETVLYLHIMGYRSPELIASAIGTGLTRNVKPKDTAALQHLDAIVDILFPDYTGPRLDEEKKKYHHEVWFPRRSIVYPARHWFSYEWNDAPPELLRKLYLDVCGAVGNDSCVGYHSILPLYEHKDLVVCHDNEGNFEPIPPTFGTEAPWEAKRPVDSQDKIYVALMLLRDRSKNGVPDYSLYQRLRRELLEKLGYRVAVVKYTVFDEVPKDVKSAYIIEALKAAK